jgi:dienelactone hydrolase
MSSSRPGPDAVVRRARGAILAAFAALAACTYSPPPAFPRPPLSLPAAIADRYALPGRPELVQLMETKPGGLVAGELVCGDETIRFHLQRTASAGRPLVLLVPILAGGREIMFALARRLVDRGFHAAWCERVDSAMSPPQRGPELEQLFRRTILHQRALLAWLRASPELAPSSTFALGISMGGIVSAVLAALEPELDGTAVCLAGADLPAIVLDSAEARVERWREWRFEADGLGSASLLQELRRHLLTDPAHLAAFVPVDRVLVVGTSLDTVVRPGHQQLLWEALGRPRRLTLPLGHYTAALAFDPIVTAITDFFDERHDAMGPLGQPVPALAARPPSARAEAGIAPGGR